MAIETQTLAPQDFTADMGIFTGEGAAFSAGEQAIEIPGEKYAYTKVTMPEFTKAYDFGDKESRDGIATNSKRFARFTARGDGGIALFVVNEALEMIQIGSTFMLNAENTNYQIELPKAVSTKITGVVIKNPAPEDTGICYVTAFNVVSELSVSDRNAYIADMFNNSIAANPEFEPAAIAPQQAGECGTV